MRFATDTGGTFTDLIIEGAGDVRMYKAHTVPGDPAKGVLDALTKAATDHGLPLGDFLAKGEVFVHGTTHAINAIITGRTARTALLTTAGHPDILVIREGGRADPFDHSVSYPDPYVPRSLTVEVPERVDYAGKVLTPLNEAALRDIVRTLKAEKVEAVAVCLLWSIVNPAHELAIGKLLDAELPGVPYTLSHQLNPTVREYRRASATSMDASLKPLMAKYLGGIESRLREAGFKGRVLVLTSQGGAMDAQALAAAPIHAINSGPSMAPIAGKFVADQDGGGIKDIIVADTGGTTYDVSLVRDGGIPWTRETWIGAPYTGHMTGFPSVDVKSVGAGGGSIAWIDAGGVLHVGPRSAGAVPGPVCYNKGGTEPTTTDACLTLGYIDPGYFLGGTISLDAAGARRAVEEKVAKPLGLSTEDAAAAIIDLVTENMVQAIADITVNQGIDARKAVLIGGGGAAGFNSVLIAKRLGCESVIFPETGAALSAAGALISDLAAEYRAACFTTSASFDFNAVNAVLTRLAADCQAYLKDSGVGAISHSITFGAEARYPSQVWDLEIPLDGSSVKDAAAVAKLVQRFHDEHLRVFAINDPNSGVEFTAFVARVRCRLRDKDLGRLTQKDAAAGASTKRKAYFSGAGWMDTPVHRLSTLEAGQEHVGPAIVESPFTTIVINPGARYHATKAGSVVVKP